MQPIPIPKSHQHLLDGQGCVALTTVMPDGQPQSTPIWTNREGDYILINTMRGFRKERNMQANPKVTLLAFDAGNPFFNMEVRGMVIEMTEDGALAHLNQLTRLYMNQPDATFFGDSVPAELAATHKPVRITILPIRVRVEV